MTSSQLTSFLSATIMVVIGFASTASAQQDNSVYALVLTTSNLDAMVQEGRILTSAVKPEKQNATQSIVISYEPTKNNAPVELDVDISYSNGKADIIIDDNLLSRIKGQPVVFEFRQRPLTDIVLRYDPSVDPIMSGAADGAVFIRLSDTKRMAGKIEGLTEFTLTTGIGELNIPMAQVAGIKFHTTADDKAVVILNNGDSVTGVPSIKAVQMTTDWGKADIEPEFIQSLTSTSGAKFRRENSDFGTRWILNTGNSLAPGALRN